MHILPVRADGGCAAVMIRRTMNYTISNDQIEVVISDVGAELMSVKSKKDGTEFLWQGDPTFWGGRAYNLFPICGRLADGKYTYEGETYEMNLHGFVRKSVLDATPLARDRIDFGLRSDERTLKMYPFDFEYHICYSLEGSTVRMAISVINHTESSMPFALGGHPGFNVPLAGEGKFEDWRLEFCPECEPTHIIFSDACLTTEEKEPFPLEEGKILRLRHDLFDRDAVVLSGASRKVALKSDVSAHSVTVEVPDAMKYLGIWHAPKKEAPYVCIEPWTSLPAYDGKVDDLATKRDMFELSPLATYELIWTITVE